MATEKREIEIALRSKSAEASADKLTGKVKGVGSSADSAANSMRLLTKVAIAVGAALATGKVAQYADSWTNVNNQIKQATNSSREALAVQEAILQIAKSSRVEIGGVADAYQRISNSVSDYGFSAKDSLDVVEGLTKAFKANGASAQEVSSVLVQLGQGLGAGALRGEELNSIMEASLPVSRAIAKEFGVQVGQLKELGAAGELVTERVFKALQNSLPEFQSSFDKASVSIKDGFEVAGNSITRLIGLTSDATGASESFASGLIELSDAIDFLGDAVASGAAGKIADLFKAQLELIGNDIKATSDYMAALWGDTANQMIADSTLASVDIGDAFLNIIPNVRTMVQVMTVEFAAGLDKLAAYAEAVGYTLNPFDDVSVDQARGYFDRQIAQVDEVRKSVLQSIFDQRVAEDSEQAKKISDAEEMLELYKKQREARSLDLGSGSLGGGTTATASTGGSSSGGESKGNGFESLQARLKLETQAIMEEAEVRRAFAEGEINKKQLDEELALQGIYYQYEGRRMAIMENEKLTAEQKTALLAELADQEIAAEQSKQDQLTGAAKEGADARTEIMTQEQMATKNMLINTAVAAFNLTQNANQQMTKEQKKQAKRSIYIQTAAAIARAYGENNFYVASGMALFLAGMQLKQLNSVDTAAASAPPSSGFNASSAAPPTVENQSQNRVINITGLEGYGDDQPIPLTVGGLRDLLSSNEDVSIAINEGQQGARRIGAI